MSPHYERYVTHYTSRRTTGWDYAGTAVYFVTICTHRLTRIFGRVRSGRMELNSVGRIVAEEWQRSEEIRDEMTLDAFIVMPDHLHGIVWMDSADDDASSPTPPTHGRASVLKKKTTGEKDEHKESEKERQLHRPARSLGSFVAGFKCAATRRINRHRDTPGASVWKRNYHDRIIRSARHLRMARQYIRDNPARWHAKRQTNG
ncbi:transposase [Longibacter salinarum]|uniref:Transposase n=1 Tax=Longibacter salinarum TaxID=1850348 RepID=A0A2A8CUM3_9BACT|nr:transposase [Longibacter salinarum]PEN11456.1 transposase [Longibacter salinarum]